MLDEAPSVVSIAILVLLTLLIAAGRFRTGRFRTPVRIIWVLFALLTVAEWISFGVAVWLFAVFSFVALREYFSLVDIRLQDRWGILGAYLSIPFMTWFIFIDWYGMFIISIPVYAFLVIPLLVALGGGSSTGTVFSLGLIDLGVFLFVFCMGHIAYLAYFSVRMAILLIAGVAFSGWVFNRLSGRHAWLRYMAATAGTLAFSMLSAPWTKLPQVHAAALGILIPFLVLCAVFTMRVIEEDLGVSPDNLEPGRGFLFDGTRVYLFAAPVVFHYLRWFLKWGEL